MLWDSQGLTVRLKDTIGINHPTILTDTIGLESFKHHKDNINNLFTQKILYFKIKKINQFLVKNLNINQK
jgi:hypothetical protein